MQEDIDKLFKWSVIWNLNFSKTKSSFYYELLVKAICNAKVLLSSKLGLLVNPLIIIMLNFTIIASTDRERDLGIWIDLYLDFHSHTHQTVSRANALWVLSVP